MKVIIAKKKDIKDEIFTTSIYFSPAVVSFITTKRDENWIYLVLSFTYL